MVQLILPVYAWTRIPAVAQNISLRTRQMKHQLKKIFLDSGNPGMSGRYPIVFRLQLHEENSQTVFFEEGQEIEALVRAQTAKISCRRRVNQTTQ